MWVNLSAGDGTKTVRAQFKDGAGNESGFASDVTTLIKDPPIVVLSINEGSWVAAPSVNLTLTLTQGAGSQM
jgi:hypothetical protein